MIKFGNCKYVSEEQEMNKEKYVRAEMEIIEFQGTAIVTESIGNGGTPPDPDFDWDI